MLTQLEPPPSAPLVTPTSACRVCGDGPLRPYLDLGRQPLANAYRSPTETRADWKVQLGVQWCPTCNLSQLTHIVAPEVLFADYKFASGVSAGWHTHCEELVRAVRARCAPRFVLDIASNDGTQLEAFQRAGANVQGVDPGGVAARVPTVPFFWSDAVAVEVLARRGRPDLIIAQNVVGHVANILDFCEAVRLVISPTGLFVIECPDLAALLEQTAFDTIYHEHVSYWSLKPMQYLANATGFDIVDVEVLPVHGGSLRYWLAPTDHFAMPADSVLQRARGEWRLRLHRLKTYDRFAAHVADLLTTARNLLLPAVNGNKRVLWGYGASAKGTVYLNALRKPLPVAVMDDSPSKQGLLMPGTNIPIVAPSTDAEAVDILWLLSWNWANELAQRARKLGFRGQFFVGVPQPQFLQ